MAVPTVAVSVHVFDANGVAIKDAIFTARLSVPEVYNNQVVARVEERTVSAADGTATLNLFPNALGTKGSYYDFVIKAPNGAILLQTSAFVPNAGSSLETISGNLSQVIPPLAYTAQPYADNLTAFSGLVGAADQIPYFTAVASLALTAFTAVGRSIVGAATMAAAATAIALGVASTPTFAGLTLSGLTANAFTYSGASGAIAATAAPTNGQLLIGSTGFAPVLGTIAGTTNQVTASVGAGSITLSLPQNIHTGATPTFAGATLTNNLTFSGTGLRIAGDFSNATSASRVLFQSSTVGGATQIGALPNGAGTNAGFVAYSSPDPANASRLLMRVDTAANDVRITSDATGTGTGLPINFLLGSNIAVTIATSGRVTANLGLTIAAAQTLTAGGACTFAGVGTTASAANAFLDNAASNNLLRSTSSLKYKGDLIDMTLVEARTIALGRHAFSYRSLSEADAYTKRWIGYAAEEIALVDERFITVDESGAPNWVQYERFIVPHGMILDDHEARIAALEAKTATLQ